MFLIDAAKLIPRVKASVDLEGERLGHGSLVGRANVMLQGKSISNLIASVFTDTSSMLVGSPLMDNAAGQIRSTFMQCRAGLPHAKPSWKSVWGKKLNGPRIYDKIRAACSAQEGCNLVAR